MADTLVLVRGLPGSGKTTFAIHRMQGDAYTSADSYFEDEDGAYKFDGSKLPEAHEWCQRRVAELLQKPDVGTVYVANTFSTRWEMQPYFDIVENYPDDDHYIEIFVVDLFDGGLTNEMLARRGRHNVPLHTIEKMRNRWEHEWSTASKVKPAKRRRDEPRNR